MAINKMITKVLIIFFLTATVVFADNSETIIVGNFSKEKVENLTPEGWEELTFKKIKEHTKYSLELDNDVVIVKAESRTSASGLIKKIKIDLNEYPIIKWRWKITGTFAGGDVTRKKGDDYPARIYITFEYDPEGLSFFEKTKFKTAKMLYGEYPPVGAINYIWASKADKDAVLPNPYTNRVMMIVVESGENKINRWVEEERNLLEDYRAAFGKNPPKISGVAVMTDSDNTGENTVSYYGDIIFKKK